ncbi:MAG: pyridoxamine 5'-phosphate oxidase family protein, partial [Ginsengibacter sp.]
MFGKLNADEIEEVLKHQIIGRIGCFGEDRVYIVPTSYAYDGESIYCHTYEGLKIDMMRKNPRVCFEVDTMGNMANWQSVIAWGIYEELTNDGDRKIAIHNLYSRIVPEVASKTLKLSPQWPFPPDDIENIKGLFFRIRLHEKTG